MKKYAGIAIILLFCFAYINAEDVQYTNNSFARLSFVAGNAYIQRAADLGYEEGMINMPVSEGDRLSTADGRAEIYIGKGKYVRLDNNTKIDFLALPQKGNDLIQIRIWAGNVYFSVNDLEKEKNLEIHTSDVSFYILDAGLYRIDVRENAETEIFVFNGMIEAAGESGSVLIKDAQRLEAIRGHFTSRPTRFMAVANDSFDRWSEYRDSQIRKQLARRYLPDELEDFEYELAEYGEWAYVPPYGYVWVPGSVDIDWRPYYHGRWIWYPLAGWTWLPYEPWGWATFHFGRWHWGVGLGWYWIPSRIWGPGWVSWYWDYDYFGWAPLSYYGYPGVIINNVYYGRYSRPYYPYNSRALTVVRKNQLKARNVSQVALSKDSIKNLGKFNLSNKAPNLRPAASKVSIQQLEGKKVFLQNKDQSVELMSGKGVKSTGLRNQGSVSADEKAAKKDSPPSTKSTQKQKIKREKTGYPSSPAIRSKNSPKTSDVRKSTSVLSRIYEHISGGTSKSVKNRSSQGTTSKTTSSSSKSRVTSSRSKSSSSPPRSSSRSSSGSSKTKKKK